MRAAAALVCALAMVTAARAATDPASAGPYTAGVRNQGIPVPSGATLSTDIYHPASGAAVDPAAGACPLIVLAHGFQSSKDVHADQGKHLATRGYITLIPNMVGGSDHSRNADDLVSLIDWALQQNADPASWLFGRINPDAIGATGHSAGGLSCLVATARDPRIGACAPMDPVDNNNLGVGSVPSITVPVAINYSESTACNNFGSPEDLYAACVPAKRGVKIVGGNHCDPLLPSNFGCELFCFGAANPARQTMYVRLVTGWFEFWLRCDAAYYEWVYGDRIQADVTAGILTYAADPDPGPIDPCPGTPPPEVTDLRVTKAGADVLLDWPDVTARPAVDGYRIYRCTSLPPFDYSLRVDQPSPSAGADRNAIGAGDLFFYQVRAFNAAGEGP